MTALSDNNMKVLIICGEDDEDCYPLAEKFATNAKSKNIDINAVFIKGLKHEFPNNLENIIIW